MTTPRQFRGFVAAMVLLASLVSVRLDAAVPGPKWLAGFPLRAGTSIILMWTPIPNATGYRLLRQSGDEPFHEIYSGPSNTFNDMSSSPSDTVTYKVAAIVKGKDSEYSPLGTIRGIERIKAPSFTGAIGSASAITLRWSAPSGAMFSNIYRAESEGGNFALLESVQAETYTDKKVEEGKSYFYRIAAVGKDGKESPRSAPIRASLNIKPASGDSATGKFAIRRLAAKGSFRGEELYELNQPSYTGLTNDGELYVLERRGIQFFDLEGQYRRRIKFEKTWGLPGGPAEERNGTLLVPFYAEQLIRRIDPTGKAVDELRYPPFVEKKAVKPKKRGEKAEVANGNPEAPVAPLFQKYRNNPNQVAIDGKGFYWILDGVRAQAIKINDKGEELAVIGRPPGSYDERDMAPTDLPAATGIQYNPVDKKLYVVLGVTAQVKVIDPGKETVVATFGGLGTGPAKFQGIGGLAFRKNGNILVLDHLMQVIKEFNPGYEHIATYVDVIERDTLKLSSNLLSSFAFDEAAQRFYISSAMGNRVYKFDILPVAPDVPKPPPPSKPQPRMIWK